MTESGAIFSLTWDPPGEHEGIGLEPGALVGTALRRDADVAIWSVAGRAAPWQRAVGTRVEAIELHYVSEGDSAGAGLWCHRVSVHCEVGTVEVVMGDAQDGELVPSADNVAVLHPGLALPPWPDVGPPS